MQYAKKANLTEMYNTPMNIQPLLFELMNTKNTGSFCQITLSSKWKNSFQIKGNCCIPL